MRDDGRDDPMVVSTWIETVLEAEYLRVMVEYTVREGGVDDWKVTVSADWEGPRLSESDLVECAIVSLFQARFKLFLEATQRRWHRFKHRLTDRFSQ